MTSIQNILIEQISVLETMSPIDFMEFRDYLYPASGFQSIQFRLLENKLGLLNDARIQYGHRQYCTYLKPIDSDVVRQTEKEPNLFSLIEAWLERTPFLALGDYTWWSEYKAAVEKMLETDEARIRTAEYLSESDKTVQLKDLQLTSTYFSSLFDEKKYQELLERGDRRLSYKALQGALLITLYNDEPILHIPYKLLTTIIDIDELLTTWRYRHALMVQRMLGVKMGTGGSSGYHYLRSTAEKHKIFQDLVSLSTFIIPRHALPPLPAPVRSQLAFHYQFDQRNGAEARSERPAVTHIAPHPVPAGTSPDAKCPFGHS